MHSARVEAGRPSETNLNLKPNLQSLHRLLCTRRFDAHLHMPHHPRGKHSSGHLIRWHYPHKTIKGRVRLAQDPQVLCSCLVYRYLSCCIFSPRCHFPWPECLPSPYLVCPSSVHPRRNSNHRWIIISCPQSADHIRLPHPLQSTPNPQTLNSLFDSTIHIISFFFLLLRL
jgi:hypothetical protein